MLAEKRKDREKTIMVIDSVYAKQGSSSCSYEKAWGGTYELELPFLRSTYPKKQSKRGRAFRGGEKTKEREREKKKRKKKGN